MKTDVRPFGDLPCRKSGPQGVIDLSFFENLTPSEIARELSVSKRTVEQHILLARKDIKTQLQKEYFRYG